MTDNTSEKKQEQVEKKWSDQNAPIVQNAKTDSNEVSDVVSFPVLSFVNSVQTKS